MKANNSLPGRKDDFDYFVISTDAATALFFLGSLAYYGLSYAGYEADFLSFLGRFLISVSEGLLKADPGLIRAFTFGIIFMCTVATFRLFLAVTSMFLRRQMARRH